MQLNDMTLFRQQAMIDGQWRDAPNGDVIAVTNPANGEQLGSVPKMGADETREAVNKVAEWADNAGFFLKIPFGQVK